MEVTTTIVQLRAGGAIKIDAQIDQNHRCGGESFLIESSGIVRHYERALYRASDTLDVCARCSGRFFSVNRAYGSLHPLSRLVSRPKGQA